MNIEIFRQAIDMAIRAESQGTDDTSAEERPANVARLATAYRALSHEMVTASQVTDYILRLNTDDDIFTYRQARQRVASEFNRTILDHYPYGLFFALRDDYDEDCGFYDEIQYADLFLLTA